MLDAGGSALYAMVGGGIGCHGVSSSGRDRRHLLKYSVREGSASVRTVKEAFIPKFAAETMSKIDHALGPSGGAGSDVLSSSF